MISGAGSPRARTNFEIDARGCWRGHPGRGHRGEHRAKFANAALAVRSRQQLNASPRACRTGPPATACSQVRSSCESVRMWRWCLRCLVEYVFLTRTGVSVGSIDGPAASAAAAARATTAGRRRPLRTAEPDAVSLQDLLRRAAAARAAARPRVSGSAAVTGTVCRQRCSECNCPGGCNTAACHCFTMLNIPCTPRLHSDDEPCPCPPPPPSARGSAAAHG